MLGLQAWATVPYRSLFSLPVPRTEYLSSNFKKTRSLNLWAISTLYILKKNFKPFKHHLLSKFYRTLVCKVCRRKRKVLKYPPTHLVIFVSIPSEWGIGVNELQRSWKEVLGDLRWLMRVSLCSHLRKVVIQRDLDLWDSRIQGVDGLQTRDLMQL